MIAVRCIAGTVVSPGETMPVLGLQEGYEIIDFQEADEAVDLAFGLVHFFDKLVSALVAERLPVFP